MALTDIVKMELGKARNFLFTPKQKEDMMQYLTGNELANHFKDAPEEQRAQLYQRLEHHLDESLRKYSGQLNSWYQSASKAGGIATTIADAYQTLISKVPLTGAQYVPLHNLMVLLKSLAEAPYMYGYFKESKDLVGILKWLGMKPVELAIPILGPLLGTGWTEKIVRQRIMYEAKVNFLKEIGAPVEAPYKALDRHAEAKTGYTIQPKYGGPMPAYA